MLLRECCQKIELGREILTHLKIYKGAVHNHGHEAQQSSTEWSSI